MVEVIPFIQLTPPRIPIMLILRLRRLSVQSRDCVVTLRNLEIVAQFEHSENALRNLKIAQIPKLRGTHITTSQSDRNNDEQWCTTKDELA